MPQCYRNDKYKCVIIISEYLLILIIFTIIRCEYCVKHTTEFLKTSLRDILHVILCRILNKENCKLCLCYTFFSNKQQELSVSKWNGNRCATCQFIHNAHSIATKSGNIFRSANVNCISENYYTKYLNIEELHVVQTVNPPSEHSCVLRQQIKNPNVS